MFESTSLQRKWPHKNWKYSIFPRWRPNDSNLARSHDQLESELWLVSRLYDTNQKRNKKSDVFPQTVAGEDDSRLKSHERSQIR